MALPMAAKRCDAAGEAADGLIDDGLENRGRQILLGRPFIDQGLDVGLGKDAAAGCDRIEGRVIPGILVQSRSIGLKERCHLVDEGTGAAGADAVHALLHVSVLEIDDLGVLAAQLDGDVCLGSDRFQRGGDRDDLLYKRNLEVIGQREPAGTGDDRVDRVLAQLLNGFAQEREERPANIGVVAPVIRKEQFMVRVQDRDLNGRGPDINS